MGTDKANLPFGPEQMLQRMVRIVREVVPVESIAVVASADQNLPPLSEGVIVTRDRQPNRGPLEGLASGLSALPPEVEAVYLTGCDTPLLVAAWIEKLFSLLDQEDIVVPQEDDFFHPLAAVYRFTLFPAIEAALAEDQLALHKFIAQCSAKTIPVEQLRDVDPELLSLHNLNTSDDYRAALELAGLTA